MTRMDMTLDGRELPKHLELYRDEDTGAMEIRFWKFQPVLLFMIPFMCVWTWGSVGQIYVKPLMAGKPLTPEMLFGGIPFVAGAIFFWSIIVGMLFGRHRIRLEYGRGSHSFKLFGLGPTRTFDLRRDTEISAGGPIRSLCVRNGSRSVMMCRGWSDDAFNFVNTMLEQHRA